MTQFYSRNDVNYSGDVYSIPFKYIHKKEVKVYIDDELWTKWHFLNTNQLTLDEVPEGIGYNNIVSVRRETDIKEKVVTYDNNSLLNKENLNKSQDQLIYAVQEIYDNNVQFQSDIREEVDEKVERVSEAVEKLDIIDASVETSVQKAQEATEQAQIATEKAEETLNTYNEAMAEIDTLRQDSIDEVNQLVADHTEDLNTLDQLIKKDADAIINRVGLNLFDTVVKDRVLAYEESKGLALQGTYVYKDAVAGSRYGYADFYNKVVEEYSEATDFTLCKNWTQPKAEANTTVIEGGEMVTTASSESGGWVAYLALNGTGTTTAQGWATNGTNIAGWWQVKFPYKIKITGLKYYRRYAVSADNATTGRFYTSSDKTIAIGNEFSAPAGANAQYSLDIVNIPNAGIITDTIYLETQAINGQYGGMDHLEITADKVSMTSLYKNSNGHIFYEIANKDSVDEYFNKYGTAWFYGIDQENERIFLPRDKYFAVKGNVPVAGNGMTLGLTNGSENAGLGQSYYGNYRYAMIYPSGYGKSVGSDGGDVTSVLDQTYGITTDPSKSGIEAHLTANDDKYLYICVGNTVSDTSWVDVVTQVEGGVKDLEDKTNEGISALANASNALRTTQITNCLLEVPQRIKYTLENGTLTLKAGSVVIVPYGTEDLTAQYPNGTTFIHENFKVVDTQFADGKFFVWAEVVNDVSGYFETSDPYQIRACHLILTTNSLDARIRFYSGTTEATATATNLNYRTDLNILQRRNNGVVSEQIAAFPIGIIMGEGSYLFGRFVNVFNGMGYIGSTVWVDKGVKGLIPNGKNADGTLKNIEYVVNNLKLHTNTSANASYVLAASSTDKMGVQLQQVKNYYYVKNISELPDAGTSSSKAFVSGENSWYYWHSNTNYTWQKFYQFVLGEVIWTSGVITGFKTKLPFRALDASSTPHITKTYVNGTSWYRVWSDGWIEQGGACSHTATAIATCTMLKSFSNTNYTLLLTCNGMFADSASVAYTQAQIVSNNTFNFRGHTNANLQNKRWYACGY